MKWIHQLSKDMQWFKENIPKRVCKKEKSIIHYLSLMVEDHIVWETVIEWNTTSSQSFHSFLDLLFTKSKSYLISINWYEPYVIHQHLPNSNCISVHHLLPTETQISAKWPSNHLLCLGYEDYMAQNLPMLNNISWCSLG